MRKRNRIVKIINISLISLFIFIILLVIYLVKNKEYSIKITDAISIKSGITIIDSEYYKEFLDIVNEGKFKKTKKVYGGLHKEISIKTNDIEYNFIIYTDKNMIVYTLDDITYVSDDKIYITKILDAIKLYDHSLVKLNTLNITYYKNKVKDTNIRYKVDLKGDNTILLEFNKDVKSIKFYQINNDDSENLISSANDIKLGEKMLYYVDYKKYKKFRIEVVDNYKKNIYESYIENDRLKFNELTKETEIVLNPTDLNLVINDKADILVENYSGIVYWYSENEKVATVNNGKVTAVGKGKTRIYIVTQDNEYIYMNVTVDEAHAILVEELTLSDKKINVGMYQTYKLEAFITPENATNKKIQWSSSNNKIAMVDSNGVVTGLSSGKAIITATSSNGISKTCEVVVEIKEIEAITLNYTEYNLKIGETINLDVNFIPSDASIKDISWNSKDVYVAKVDREGLVTAVDYGKTVITATTKNGKSVNCTINVIK